MTTQDYRNNLRHLLGRMTKVLPRKVLQWIQHARGRSSDQIPLGALRFGDFRRLLPVDANFGWGRGSPIDRYYIDAFLSRNADQVRGCVLEFGDDRYSRRFGGNRVVQANVMSLEATNANATIVGDLQNVDALPEAKYDCIILTQVLQLIFDPRAAIETLYRALRPGGVLLATMPGLAPMMIQNIPLHWAVTAPTLSSLLETHFGKNSVSVESHGNVFVAAAFLYGIAVEELYASELNANDARYPVIVAARAIRQPDVPNPSFERM